MDGPEMSTRITPAGYPTVPDSVTSVCDGASVGVIIRDTDGRWLLLRRVRPPEGMAPVAGHIDDHGSPEDAARAEVSEEVGLAVISLTHQFSVWHPGPCRRHYRPGHTPGHAWTVYEAIVTGDLAPDATEAADVAWHTTAQLRALAMHTVAVAQGTPGLHQRDGLEPVWVEHLAALGHIQISPADMVSIRALAARSPYEPPR